MLYVKKHGVAALTSRYIKTKYEHLALREREWCRTLKSLKKHSRDIPERKPTNKCGKREMLYSADD